MSTHPTKLRWETGTGSSDIPAMGDRVNLSAEVSDLSSPTYVIGEIPERSDDGTSQFTENQYSCIFGFRQKVSDRGAAGVADATRLFEDGESGSMSSPKTSGWITEGTNELGRVDVVVETINVPSGDTDSQTWLKNRQSSSTGQLWPNFRIEEEGSISKCETRNPLIYTKYSDCGS